MLSHDKIPLFRCWTEPPYPTTCHPSNDATRGARSTKISILSASRRHTADAIVGPTRVSNSNKSPSRMMQGAGTNWGRSCLITPSVPSSYSALLGHYNPIGNWSVWLRVIARGKKVVPGRGGQSTVWNINLNDSYTYNSYSLSACAVVSPQISKRPTKLGIFECEAYGGGVGGRRRWTVSWHFMSQYKNIYLYLWSIGWFCCFWLTLLHKTR